MRVQRKHTGNRLLSLLLALVLVAGVVPLSVFAATNPTTSTNVNTVLSYAQNLLNTNFSNSGGGLTWDTEKKTDTWRYYNGVMVDALLMAGVNSDKGNALKFASDFYDAAVNEDGTTARYSGDSDTTNDTNFGQELDSIAPARGLFYLLGTVEDQDKYETLLHSMYAQLSNTAVFKTYDNAGGNYLHKTTWTDWQIGLDGLYMAQPFLMEYANAISDGRLTNTNNVTVADIYKAVYDRLVWVADYMGFSVEKDGQTVCLYNHGWNVETSTGNGVVWARGVGWYAAALVDVIELMPAGTYKDGLISKLSKLFDGMIAYQDETTGMWYNVVYPVYTDETNKLETSGTALMAYALMKAYNNGWVTDTKYSNAGLKAFNGLVNAKITTDGKITDIYKSSGVSTDPNYYCTNSTYEADEAKGVGPVIMAASQANIMNGGTETYTIGVAKASADLTVAVGETVDLSSVTATVVSNRGTVTNIANNQLTFDPATVDTSAAGTQEVAVTYGAVDCGTVTVTVYDENSGESSGSSGNIYAHNFTADGTTSSFYTISGNLSTSKGTVTYKDLTLTQCLKMESSTSITFTAANAGTLTLVFGGDTDASGKTVKIDGTSYTADANGIVTVELSSGSHTIAKGDAINLFYMEFAEEGASTDPEPAEVTYTIEVTVTPTSIQVGETAQASATITASDDSEHAYTVEWTIDGVVSTETDTSVSISGDTVKNVTVTAKLKTVDGKDYTGTEVSSSTTLTITDSSVPSDTNTYVRVTSVENGKGYVIATGNDTLGYGNDGSTTNNNTASWQETNGVYQDLNNVVQLWTFELADEEEDSYYIYYTDTEGAKHYLVCDNDNYPSLTTTLVTDEATDSSNTTRWKVTAVSTSTTGAVNIVAQNPFDRANLSVDSTKGAKLEVNTKNLNLYALVPPSSISLTVPPLMVGNAYKLAPTVKYNNAIIDAGNYTVEYTSSDKNVAKVETDSDGNQVVRAVGQGTATLTAALKTVNGETVSESITTVVSVSVAAPTIELGADLSLTVGETRTLTPEVKLGDAVLDAENYTVTWESSDPAVVSVDTNGNLTIYDNDVASKPATATATITAALTSVNGSNVSDIQDTITITVDYPAYTITPNTITIPLNGKSDFSGVTMTIVSSVNGQSTTVSYDDLEFRVVDSKLDTGTAGTYTVPVYYEGVKRGEVTVTVDSDPYYGLKDAASFPEYPDAGAVRMEKFSTSQNFTQTGVVQIELNAAGVSTKDAIDVVLVVDVSNSMGWTMDWFNGMTAAEVAAAKDSDKIPTDGGTTKLDAAMDAAKDFASILLSGNTTGSDTNNTLTFVTFGGHDVGKSEGDYMDSVVTAFTGVDNLTLVNNSFNNTKFTSMTPDSADGSVDYTLQIAGTTGTAIASGVNRGNTNYDFAFLEAMAAVKALKEAKAGSVENYDAGDREVHVVFMTDGAPSHYNDYCYGNSNYGGGFTTFNGTDADWLTFIQNYNEDATDLYSQVDGFYTVGFDLAHGGFGTHNWTEAELGRVLNGLVKNEALEYTLASDTTALNQFFTELGQALSYAGTQAVVSDTLSSDFVLKTTPIDMNGNTEGGETKSVNIQVLSRRLVTRSDIGSTLKLTVEGVEQSVELTAVNIEQYLGATVVGDDTILETVTFDSEGVAHSSKKGESVNIWDAENGIIEAEYFTYDFTTKTFTWKIGNITDREVALTYYAYLDGALGEYGENKTVGAGLYPTNEGATLTYIDINGDKAAREYPIPEVAWGEASVGVRFYLVNEKGQYVNMAGQTFTNPANRVFLTERAYYAYTLNSNTTVIATEALADAGLKVSNSVVALYDDQIQVTVTNNGIGGTGSYTLTAPKAESLVDVYDLTGGKEFIQTIINIPVMFTDRPTTETPLAPETVVVDFGKPMEIHVFNAAETAQDALDNYNLTVVGFAPYDSSFHTEGYLNVGEWTVPTAGAPFSTAFGEFTISDGDNGKIIFTPTTILDGVKNVFVAVKIEVKSTEQTTEYYLYNTVTIVPATSVYYETDFATGVFTTTGTWTTQGTSSTGMQDSDPSNIPVEGTESTMDTYGYDSSYLSDNLYSNGSSLQATGEGVTTTTVSFSFTGTGFDIISRTGAQEGTIRVTVYSDPGYNQPVKHVTVLNKGVNELYQIPVVSIENLLHDTYYVEIGVYQKVEGYTDNLATLNRGNSFYFDAVRIYGTAKDDPVAEAEYELDGEANALIKEIRDIIIDSGTFNATSTEQTGAIFIDTDQENETGSGYTVADYQTIGPNNEMYLGEGQAIAFTLGWSTAPASIDLGAKAVEADTGTTNTDENDTDENDTTNTVAKLNVTIRTVGDSPTESNVIWGREINTCTALYYNLLDGFTPVSNSKVYVVIQNTGTGILSLTDLKIAYGAENVAENNISLLSDLDTYEAAVQILDHRCDVISTEFADDTVRVMRTTTMTVVTTQYVETLTVTDANGNPVWNTAVYVDTADGNRIWTVTLRPVLLGDLSYLVTGYNADGTPGEKTASDIIHVQY